MKYLWSLLTLALSCFRINGKDVFLLVPTRPEVLYIIQYYHDATHARIRTSIHAVQMEGITPRC